MENTDSLMGGCSHQEGGEEALQQKLLFPRCRALCGLGGGSTRWTVLQPFGSELHGGMSLTTSAGHGRRLYALSVGVKGRINDSPCEGAVGREPGEISER